MRKPALILLILLIGCISLLNAATTGRLAVRVRDNSNKPLEFVNIVVMRGNQRITGGQTDSKGVAIIINIPLVYIRLNFLSDMTYNYTDVRFKLMNH